MFSRIKKLSKEISPEQQCADIFTYDYHRPDNFTFI